LGKKSSFHEATHHTNTPNVGCVAAENLVGWKIEFSWSKVPYKYGS